MLDYKLVEALAIVVQEGGFDKAAHFLNLTQSAVSQRVKLLEEQTGQIVLARTSPPRATPAGQRMIKHYIQVKRLEDDLFETLIPSHSEEFVTLAIGTNRDCLSTWLMDAVQPFLIKKRVVLEFRAADQEQTHKLMKDGEVIGCISVKDQPMQGCKTEYIGDMDYWMVAANDFINRWLPNGINSESIKKAPLILFDRKDEMHMQFFRQVMRTVPPQIPIHYVPSTKAYTDFIVNGLAYGLLPDKECRPLFDSGHLAHIAPDTPISVKLYWHCWNLRSQLLEEFSKEIAFRARELLARVSS